MIQLQHQQRSLWEGLFAEEVAELWEPWMRVVDELLEDEALVDAVYEAQGERHEQSRTLGRPQTPAEVALRMLLLKHVHHSGGCAQPSGPNSQRRGPTSQIAS